LTYLQEKLKSVKRNERGADVVVILGVILAALGFAAGSTLWGVIGIITAAAGVFYSVTFSSYYNRLMKELEKMATPNSKCPKCGKELPNGNYRFCPFCGASLEQKQN
jgi:ribosomal protein S27AE